MKRLYNTLIAIALSALVTSVWAQKQVEYFWDTDPGVGKGKVLEKYSGTEALIETTLDVSKLSVGVHQLGLRVLNDKNFSATYYRSFYVPPQTEAITRIEYAWDEAPALGEGTPLTFTAGNTVDLTQSLAVSDLKAGMHTLYIRALTAGHHSQTYSRSFYVPPTAHQVEAVEYYFDEDPGVGKATRVVATLKNGSLDMAFDVDVEGLSEGVHHIGLRTLTDATWSATKVRQFLVRQVEENTITHLEYFWNNDPGEGRAYAVDITPGKEVTVNFEADMTELGEGPHSLGLRARSGSNTWSPAKYVSDIPFEGWDNLQEYLNSLHDTEDELSGNTYTRQFLNKDWQALYVPFSLSYDDWSAHFEIARINAFYQYDDDENGDVDRQVLEAIIIKPGNGKLKPNHPYLIRAKQKGTYTFTFDAATQVAEKVNTVSCATLEAKYSFTGNYAKLTGLKTDSRYRILGNALSIPDNDEEVLPPYRWYLTIDDLGNQLNKVRLRFVSGTTGIDETNFFDDDESIGNKKVYDLSGRRVNAAPDARLSSLPKGIYIINNRKYIVK